MSWKKDDGKGSIRYHRFEDMVKDDKPAPKEEDAYEKALKELNKAFKKKGIKFE